MKNLFLILCFFWIGGNLITWPNGTEHDFGDIEQGVPVTHEFKFLNNDDEALVIDNVRSSCGCTAPEWSLEPILPDSTGTILIRYDAKKTGYFRKKIKVYLSTQRRAEKLAIEGWVE